MNTITIITDDGSKAPVPEGYTPERVIEVLREVGLEPVQIRQADGTVIDLQAQAA